ncbi:hypothetical protein HAX54_039190, partial [Datura stramonium]|nr:hypothetical protein [Datura stramonium]
ASPHIFEKEVTSNQSTLVAQTPGKRQINPEIQKDIDEADHFIYDHPYEVTGGQNNSDDQHNTNMVPIQIIISDLETPIVVQNSTRIACDPPDPMFAVCNLNTSGCRDFDPDEYRQVYSSNDILSNSKDETIYTKDICFVVDTSLWCYYFLDVRNLGPPATRTKLRIKTR